MPVLTLVSCVILHNFFKFSVLQVLYLYKENNHYKDIVRTDKSERLEQCVMHNEHNRNVR